MSSTATMTAPAWQLLAAERDLQDAIRTAALRNNWLFYHTHRSDRSDRGFPDCCCVKDGRMLFLEIKAQKGRVSPKQRAWIDALEDVPMVTAAVVRPAPKHDGELSFDDALELLGGA